MIGMEMTRNQNSMLKNQCSKMKNRVRENSVYLAVAWLLGTIWPLGSDLQNSPLLPRWRRQSLLKFDLAGFSYFPSI